jgi:hypothetical protein
MTIVTLRANRSLLASLSERKLPEIAAVDSAPFYFLWARAPARRAFEIKKTDGKKKRISISPPVWRIFLITERPAVCPEEAEPGVGKRRVWSAMMVCVCFG